MGSLAAAAIGLSGCASTERAEPYGNNEWLQSGANRIANLALRDNLQSIRRVQLSLYRRNPREWRKWATSAEDATQRTWDAISQDVPLAQLRGATGIDAIRLAFETQPGLTKATASRHSWSAGRHCSSTPTAAPGSRPCSTA